MNDFINAHNQYLEPPDGAPYCEDGCGETMERDGFTGEWICVNKFCPLKFDGTAREMAEELVDVNETVKILARKIQRMKTPTAI